MQLDPATASDPSQTNKDDMVSQVTEECDEKMKNIPSYEANGHSTPSGQQSSRPSKLASDTSKSHFEHPMSLDEVFLKRWKTSSCPFSRSAPADYFAASLS